VSRRVVGWLLKQGASLPLWGIASLSEAMSSAAAAAPLSGEGVYVLKLAEVGYYYVGASRDIERRVREHKDDQKVAWVAAHGGVLEVLAPMTPRETPTTTWEMKETLARMMSHGYNHVRGWEYCSPRPLTDSDLDGISKIMCGGLAVPLCRSCGFPGHSASTCSTACPADWMKALAACRSKKTPTAPDFIVGMVESSRTKREHQQQLPAQHDHYEDEDDDAKRPRVDSGGCSRCHRACHTVDRCYAKKTEDGQLIEDAAPPAAASPVATSGKGGGGCSRCHRACHTAERCYAKRTCTGMLIEDV